MMIVRLRTGSTEDFDWSPTWIMTSADRSGIRTAILKMQVCSLPDPGLPVVLGFTVGSPASAANSDGTPMWTWNLHAPVSVVRNLVGIHHFDMLHENGSAYHVVASGTIDFAVGVTTP